MSERVTHASGRRKLITASARAFLASALVFSLLLPMAHPVPASASTWVVDTSSRTQEQVQQRWSQLKPSHSGSPYASAPRTRAPYAAGSLASGFAQDGLKTVNFARYLAGLPSDVTLSSSRNREAQHGAVLLAATGTLTHYPNKPSDMSQSFYDLGRASTESSNIGFGQTCLVVFQNRCLSDLSSASNLRAVGHRRWLLNPPMKVTGVGFANGWATTYVFDRSRSHPVSYSAITWPSAGAFPVQMFCPNTPWSITLNPALYDIDQGSTQHAVTLRRVGDGRTWSFNSSHTNTSGHYFSTDFRGMGVPNVFVFRPGPSTIEYRPGDEFDVTLSVRVRNSATPRTVSYRTTFVSMYERDAYEPDDTMATASRILPGQTQPRSFDYAGDRDWVYFDAQRGVELEISSPGVRAELYDSSGRHLTTFSGTRTEVWNPPSDGRYYLLLEGSPVGHEPRRYELSVVDPAQAPTRVEGSNRFATAVEASKLAFPRGAATVVIATGRSWPDALGGTALAGVLDAPVLLSGTTALPDVVKDEIARLGARKAIIVGGTSAVGSGVEAELKKSLGSTNVERIAGSNRYQTADRVAARVIKELGSSYDGTAFVATGRNFPDALAAAPIAASEGWPLFLVHPTNGLGDLGRTELRSVTNVLILGGTGVVSADVEAKLAARLGPANVERLPGSNRYATAATVARWGADNTGLGWDSTAMATGRNFPDALAGGVLQARRGSVLLLTPPRTLSPDSAVAITDNREAISDPTFLGGPSAVGHEVRNTVIELLHQE